MVLQEKETVELDTLREGFRTLLSAKFRNEWIDAKQQLLDKDTRKRKAAQEVVNETLETREMEGLITETFDAVRAKIKKEEAEAARLAALNRQREEGDAPDPLGAARNTRAKGKRRLKHSSTTDLTFATARQANEYRFAAKIEEAYDEVMEAMKLSPTQAQFYHCLGVIEYMRRQKAVAIVGPVCSGKTQILRVVSQTLKLAYDIMFRTSAINPQTFTREEFYGPINAFESQTKKDQDDALKKKSIFQIVLDTYQHEKLSLAPDLRNKYVQSFLLDADKMDSYFMDSLIEFIQKSNIREREYYEDQEFLLHLASTGDAHDTLIQHLPITLPNGNVVMLPSDLYFFFETESLRNASPLFLTQIGLVITQAADFTWGDLYQKNKDIFHVRHKKFSESPPHKLGLIEQYELWEKDFLFPMIKALDKNEQVREWPLWNLKSLVLQFFKLLNSMTFKF